jgi:predicted RNA-binding Zn-ribbon protein involved in translation (DUF1610 family)
MLPKILLLDIETAPNKVYTWGLWEQNVGTNQIINPGYVLSWAAKWVGTNHIMFDSLIKHPENYKKNHQDDSAIAMSMWKLMDEADIIIAHNGDNFDLKWLNTIFVKNRLKPVAPYKSIDTLSVARRYFKFQSNKLEYLAEFFNIGSKHEHPGFLMWENCMNPKINKPAWNNMERYNRHDIVLLEGVYNYLKPFMSNHPNLALYGNLTDKICPSCLSKNIHKDGVRRTYTNVNVYQRYECNDCGRHWRGSKSLLTKEQRENLLRSPA